MDPRKITNILQEKDKNRRTEVLERNDVADFAEIAALLSPDDQTWTTL